MIPTDTRDATNRYDAPANWNDENGKCGALMVRVDTYGTDHIIECISTWKPDAEELRLLNLGGVIEIGLSIPNQCVMRAYVVMPVDNPPMSGREKAGLTINEEAHGNEHVTLDESDMPVGGDPEPIARRRADGEPRRKTDYQFDERIDGRPRDG